eukprot:284818816_5
MKLPENALRFRIVAYTRINLQYVSCYNTRSTNSLKARSSPLRNAHYVSILEEDLLLSVESSIVNIVISFSKQRESMVRPGARHVTETKNLLQDYASSLPISHCSCMFIARCTIGMSRPSTKTTTSDDFICAGIVKSRTSPRWNPGSIDPLGGGLQNATRHRCSSIGQTSAAFNCYLKITTIGLSVPVNSIRNLHSIRAENTTSPRLTTCITRQEVSSSDDVYNLNKILAETAYLPRASTLFQLLVILESFHILAHCFPGVPKFSSLIDGCEITELNNRLFHATGRQNFNSRFSTFYNSTAVGRLRYEVPK